MKTSTTYLGLNSGPDQAMPRHTLASTATTVLVPMLNLGVASDMIELAAILAAGPRAERMRNGRASATSATSTSGADPRVVVVGVVEVPPDQPLTTGLIAVTPTAGPALAGLFAQLKSPLYAPVTAQPAGECAAPFQFVEPLP